MLTALDRLFIAHPRAVNEDYLAHAGVALRFALLLLGAGLAALIHAIIPALFIATYPELGAINVMGLATPQSAILSAVIFNALIIVALIPLALKGVAYRPVGAAALLRRNLLVYGLGGLIVPFVGIKIIDLAVSALHLA